MAQRDEIIHLMLQETFDISHRDDEEMQMQQDYFNSRYSSDIKKTNIHRFIFFLENDNWDLVEGAKGRGKTFDFVINQKKISFPQNWSFFHDIYREFNLSGLKTVSRGNDDESLLLALSTVQFGLEALAFIYCHEKIYLVTMKKGKFEEFQDLYNNFFGIKFSEIKKAA